MTELIIRPATVDDVDTLIGLITALADFENLPPPDDDARARLIEHGFGDRPKYEAWIAEWEGVAVGYSIMFETYSTFLARPTLYLEDVFVLPDYRRGGIGKALLHNCFRLANERGCGRMEWTCLDWNTRAQDVYEGLGAKRMSEWLLYRLTQDEISKLMSK